MAPLDRKKRRPRFSSYPKFAADSVGPVNFVRLTVTRAGAGWTAAATDAAAAGAVAAGAAGVGGGDADAVRPESDMQPDRQTSGSASRVKRILASFSCGWGS